MLILQIYAHEWNDKGGNLILSIEHPPICPAYV